MDLEFGLHIGWVRNSSRAIGFLHGIRLHVLCLRLALAPLHDGLYPVHHETSLNQQLPARGPHQDHFVPFFFSSGSDPDVGEAPVVVGLREAG